MPPNYNNPLTSSIKKFIFFFFTVVISCMVVCLCTVSSKEYRELPCHRWRWYWINTRTTVRRRWRPQCGRPLAPTWPSAAPASPPGTPTTPHVSHPPHFSGRHSPWNHTPGKIMSHTYTFPHTSRFPHTCSFLYSATPCPLRLYSLSLSSSLSVCPFHNLPPITYPPKWPSPSSW